MEYLINIKNYHFKFILSLSSAIVHQLGSSIVTTIGNFCVYFVSYIHYKDTWVNMQYGNMMSSIIFLLLSSFSPLSGVMEKNIGPRLTLLISSLIIEVSLILYYFQRNLWLFYAISVLIGLGSGLSIGVTEKNSCRYYPKYKGIINSSTLFISYFAGSFYSYLGEIIINPNYEKVIDKDTNPLYPEEVSKRSVYFFLLSMIVIPITCLLSILMFIKYEPKEDENQNLTQKEIKDEDKTTNTGEIINNFRFWRINLLSSLTPFWVYFLTGTYRAYLPLLDISQNTISKIPTIVNIIYSISGVLWAFLVDKFGFKIIIRILTLISLILSILFVVFSLTYNLFSSFYLIGFFFSTIMSRSSYMSIMVPHIMNIYEFRNYLIIGGFSKLFVQIIFFITSLISVLISLKYKTAEDLLIPYKIIIYISSFISIFGFILSFYENDEKFEFKDSGYTKTNTNDIEKEDENLEIGNRDSEQTVKSKEDNEEKKENENTEIKE